MTTLKLGLRRNFLTTCHTTYSASIYLMSGATPVNPKDPTRRKNYAATKDDLLHLIQSSYGQHKIERVYNSHIQTLTTTIAADEATRDMVKHTTKRHIGSIGQFRLNITPKSTGQHDTTDHNTRIERITKRLQEFKEADHTFDFKEYTSKTNKQAFLIVHDSEATLQSVSNDHTLLSIGIQASPIFKITGRPISPTTNQTVGAATNMISPDHTDVHTDVSRANTEINVSSPVPNEPTAAPERVHQNLNFRPPSSKGFFTSLRTNAYVMSQISSISPDIMVY